MGGFWHYENNLIRTVCIVLPLYCTYLMPTTYNIKSNQTSKLFEDDFIRYNYVSTDWPTFNHDSSSAFEITLVMLAVEHLKKNLLFIMNIISICQYEPEEEFLAGLAPWWVSGRQVGKILLVISPGLYRASSPAHLLQLESYLSKWSGLFYLSSSQPQSCWALLMTRLSSKIYIKT